MSYDDADHDWWQHAVIYQIYLRSFADGNGDGIGDLTGLRQRLPYLHELGVDAIWITPWYPTPGVDGGYDVSDYCGINPEYGTLADADAVIAEAHRLGIRVIADLVPNHTSDQHPWFRRAAAAEPGDAARDRYWFRPGRGERADQPPNNWQSLFGGPAWTRLTPDGPDWYLHLFAAGQPDLNWTDPQLAGEFDAVLRFWFDRGIDGFRIDVAHGLSKDPQLPDLLAEDEQTLLGGAQQGHPHWDRDETIDIYRRWRAVADSYDPPRVFVAEAWVEGTERLRRYLSPDALHSAFNFGLLGCPWDAAALRREIVDHLAGLGRTAPATWVLSNHDVIRHVTRYGRAQTSLDEARQRYGEPVDLDLGRRRARAAALLTLALPGSTYVYQGDELGLAEVEDLPAAVRQDPNASEAPGRDGCRIPIPWAPDGTPSHGFGATDRGWLPSPPGWAGLSVAVQDGDPDSSLTLYRTALAVRRKLRAPGDEHDLHWFEAGPAVLAFRRGALGCVVNLGAEPVRLNAGANVVLSSGSGDPGVVEPDTAAWVHLPAGGDELF
ncbi:MAG TPA: glycoside hydrolase family 13 protein [Jatrophihabitans sp.]|nr:glycoside hydrolase family 13 protein [Jatrophihabitans sp.]